MAERKDFNPNERDRLARESTGATEKRGRESQFNQEQGASDAEGLKAGLADISGIRKEDLQDAVADPQKSARVVVDWIQGNYGVLIAAGLGVATVGFVTLWLNRRGGLRSFYEEESSSPTIH